MNRRVLVGVLVVAGLALAFGAGAAVNFAAWTLPAVEPSAGAEFGFGAARVDAVCDGRHRLYIARSGPVPTSNFIQIAVVPDGCVAPTKAVQP
jgi:hypothetical protein